MPKFELLVGSHYENGKIYRRGETLSSIFPLDDRFPGRFVCLDEKTEVKTTPIPALTKKEVEDSAKVATPADTTPAEALYELSPRKDKKFDIISLETGDAVNKKPLTKTLAEKTCKELNKK